ncbi:hypothetical protein CLS_20140 [[Clostridium] cf. saccharolyticum K10]|nr:hypothetical protein CLS_20140 [[Clostridium] cf. saccharolyticum K10]
MKTGAYTTDPEIDRGERETPDEKRKRQRRRQ